MIKGNSLTTKTLEKGELDQIRLYESWCYFCRTEYVKNIICILEHICQLVYNDEATIPQRLLKVFGLNSDAIGQLILQRAKNRSIVPNQYNATLHNQIIQVGGLVARPLQVLLGKLPTMTNIMSKQGQGWEDVLTDHYFRSSSKQPFENLFMTTSKEFEECFILFSTMTSIKVTHVNINKKDHNDYERIFEIRCDMQSFQVTNDSIRRRHRELFSKEKYDFIPTRELIMSMPFDYVNELPNEQWKRLDKGWLKYVRKTLKQAASNSIKEIKLSRVIVRNDFYGQSKELTHNEQCLIYLITMNNLEQTQFYVDLATINDIIGDDDPMCWADFNCIGNIGAHSSHMLSWGKKQKSREKFDFEVGDTVNVSNHGTKWDHLAKVISINVESRSAIVRWETTRKKEEVTLASIKKHIVDATNQRKRKATDFFMPQNFDVAFNKTTIEPGKDGKKDVCPVGQVKNEYYDKDNLSKLCAEGSILNLLNMLHISKDKMEMFWNLATADIRFVEKNLGEIVPKKVLKSSLHCDSIEKCLWILRKKFGFETTSKVNLDKVKSLKQALAMLQTIKFPMVIGISSLQACYDHVVVVFQGKIIDFESKYTNPLNEDSLRNICGENTTFQKISSGYGLFPSKDVKKKTLNNHVKDWGVYDYLRDQNIRHYFKT